MAGPFDLTGQNIENTYQRILQTPDGVNVYDGTGSAFTVTAVINTSSLVTTSSFNAFTSSINTFTSSYNTGSFSGSFTGSFNGTASWATNAQTSSNGFPYTGSAIITGSLLVSGGFVVRNSTNGNKAIDSNSSSLYYSDGDVSVGWADSQLRDTGNTVSINWNERTLFADNNETIHIDWTNPSYMNFPSVNTNVPIVNVLGLDINGNLYATASTAFGGGGISGLTTVGNNLITLPNPTAIRYLKINADNSVTTLTAAQLQNDLGQYRATLASDVSITAANTTVVDITGLSFPITAGKKYKFKATLLYGASAGTQGLRIGINADVSANAVYYMTTQVSSNTPSATAFISFNSTAFGSVSQNVAANLTNGIAFIEGYIDANNTGTVIGRFSKGGSLSGSLTIRSGSFIDYEEFL